MVPCIVAPNKVILSALGRFFALHIEASAGANGLSAVDGVKKPLAFGVALGILHIKDHVGHDAVTLDAGILVMGADVIAVDRLGVAGANVLVVDHRMPQRGRRPIDALITGFQLVARVEDAIKHGVELRHRTRQNPDITTVTLLLADSSVIDAMPDVNSNLFGHNPPSLWYSAKL